MLGVNLVLKLVVFAWVINSCTSVSVEGNSYVREACSVTRYQDLCVHSLVSFSTTAKQNPSIWARAGVSVTISEAKSVAQYLMKVKSHGSLRGRNQMALNDCIECFQEAIDNLHQSLDVLRKLNNPSFYAQLWDVTTWLSSAMTDQDTCLDGFDGQKGKDVKLLLTRVSNVTCITSNALALVNKLATTGPESVNSP
ncbi:pectinesterase inhibitor 6-like [Actinidia eriantha]|uniref:pectinesterase inhibitor 6-like n=1 Tax=Actinidia eriantha TaxID=165200 RepID=UPI00258AEB40|nr:pectinesterase inhibitor 6-like [Actinidia eriantha]